MKRGKFRDFENGRGVFGTQYNDLRVKSEDLSEIRVKMLCSNGVVKKNQIDVTMGEKIVGSTNGVYIERGD